MLLPDGVVVLARPNPATAPLASTLTVYCPSRVPSEDAFAVNCCSTVTPVPPALLSLAVNPLTVLAAAVAEPLALLSERAALLANVDACDALVVAVLA
jgi:hypothetical protein